MVILCLGDVRLCLLRGCLLFLGFCVMWLIDYFGFVFVVWFLELLVCVELGLLLLARLVVLCCVVVCLCVLGLCVWYFVVQVLGFVLHCFC